MKTPGKIATAILTALLFVSIYAQAQGATWRPFHNKTDDSVMFFDYDSMVTPTKTTVNVWIKHEVRAKIYSLSLWEISCAERKMRTLIKHGYDTSIGAIIELPNSEDKYPTKWNYIVPETHEAKLASMLCSKSGTAN